MPSFLKIYFFKHAKYINVTCIINRIFSHLIILNCRCKGNLYLHCKQEDLTMENKGNVLVIGNSGSGKSTLINAVLGDEYAETGGGTSGTTDKLKIYPADELLKDVPFRIIDTIGFEPSFLKRAKAVNAVRKWSKESADDDKENKRINVIWFCVEGTSRKLFPDTIRNMIKAVSIYRSVPIIVVITKSYSEEEAQDNIKTVKDAFTANKSVRENLYGIIPVVAKAYPINQETIVAPRGIEELIQLTNQAMPEGKRAADTDIGKFKLERNRALAHSLVLASSAAAAAVGAIPIPIADGAVLSPLEMGMVSSIARIYGIKKNDTSTKLFNTIVEIGTIGAVAKAIISGIKAIPGIHAATSVINASVASTIVATLGETSIYIFEQIYLGNRKTDDLEWVKKVFADKNTTKIIGKINETVSTLPEDVQPKEVFNKLTEILFNTKKQ